MMSRRNPPVLLSSANDLLEALRSSALLPADVVEGLAAEGAGEARARAAELVERGLLTGYQAEQLLAGRGDDLVVGPYRVLDVIGTGGMGQVFKAEHVLMKRVVALKVIARRPASTGDSDAAWDMECFRREVQNAAQLCHPNIITAFDAGEARGVRYLVMEYVEGIDLERLVGEIGPLSVQAACAYVCQAATALQYAFERGLLHRDVKPANLLVTTERGFPGLSAPAGGAVVKVLDFGLSCRTETRPDVEAPGLSGTPDYIAPEVAHDSSRRDVRSDLYSLGCTFYFLLTGRVPFPGGTWTEKLLRHQFEAPVPLRVLAPHVPPEVTAIVERLMAKDPARRYSTPQAVVEALEKWLRQAKPAPSPRRQRLVGWFASVIAAVLAGLLAAWALRRPFLLLPDAPQTPAPAPVATLPFAVEGRPGLYGTLAEAVAAAGDGDTLTVHGTGPFATGPVSLQGKALTLRAAPGASPCLLFTGGAAPWQALLSADRPLTIEGIELRDGLAEGASQATAHLVWSEGAPLSLRRCRMTAPRRAALVVCRGSRRVEMRDCEVTAGALALSIEVPTEGCEIVLTGNCITAADPGAAAISLWAAEGNRPARPRLEMAGNTITASRPLALRLPTGLDRHDDGPQK